MEKLIELINYIDNNFDYIDVNDLYMDPNNVEYFNKFSDILDNINLDDNMLHMISKLDKRDIFYLEIGAKFSNNINRKRIVEYLDNDNILFDFELVKKYVKDNYKLVNYLKDKSKILELVDLNEKVILLLPVEYLTEDFVLNNMNKSNFITEIFLGLYGDNNNLYNSSMFYKNNRDINSLLYKQSKKYIDDDCYIFIHSSELVKNNKDISKYVISIDPKFRHYVGDEVKDNLL